MLRSAAFAAALLTALALVLVPGTAQAADDRAAVDRARTGLTVVQARLDTADAYLEVLDERAADLQRELDEVEEQRATTRRQLRAAIAARAEAEQRHAEAHAQAQPVEAVTVEEPAADESRGAVVRSAVAAAGPGWTSDGLAGVLDAAQQPEREDAAVDEEDAAAALAHLQQVRAELEAQTAVELETQRTLVARRTDTAELLASRAYDLEIAYGVTVAEREMARALHASLEERVEQARAAMGALRDQAGAPGTGPYVWPTTGAPTSGFGPRIHPVYGAGRLHAGVDIPGPVGQPIVAAAAGTVIEARAMSGYGLTVVLEHADGSRTLYAHMSEIAVVADQEVEQAERIGSLGNTGVSTGPHLHFEVHLDNSPVNPMQWFD